MCDRKQLIHSPTGSAAENSLSLFQRQCDCEGGAAARRAFHGNGALAQVDDPFDQCETETVSVGFARGIALVEFFKDMPLHFGRDSGALVGNGHGKVRPGFCQTDADDAVVRGMLDGVVDDIAPDLLHQLFISAE